MIITWVQTAPPHAIPIYSQLLARKIPGNFRLARVDDCERYCNGSCRTNWAPPTESVVLGSGPRPSAKARSSTRRPCSNPGRPIIALNAARLVIDPIFLVALPGEVLLDGPRPRPHGRILDHRLVGEGLWPGACPALDQMQVLARPENVRLGGEVRHVDDERVALPMAARVAEPLPMLAGRWGLPFITMLRCQPWPWFTS